MGEVIETYSTDIGILGNATLNVHVRYIEKTCDIDLSNWDLDKSNIMTALAYDIEVIERGVTKSDPRPCPEGGCQITLTVHFTIKQYLMGFYFIPIHVGSNDFEFDISTPCLKACCPADEDIEEDD